MLTKIKRKLIQILPNWFMEWYKCVKSADYKYLRNQTIHFGNMNADKTFYIFRADIDNWGLYSVIFCSFLNRLLPVVEKGYVPVFDMQNYRPHMMEDGKSLNLWDRYFGSYPGKVELSEVYKSRNVILSTMNSTENYININTKDGFEYLNNPTVREIFNTYMAPSGEVLEKVNIIYNECFKSNDKVLGISVRECYRYVAFKYEDGSYLGHPKVLPLEEQIETVEQYMQEWNCNKLFLMIDDREGLEIFQKHFGDRLIHFEHPLAHYFRNGEIQLGDELTVELDGNNGDRLINYLVEVEILARCDCMISSLSSGAEAAILRNDGKYEHCELIDLGVYKADDVKK